MRLILAALIVVSQVAVPALRPGEWVVEADQSGSITGEVYDPVAEAPAAGVVVRLSRPRTVKDKDWPEPWVEENAGGSERLAAIATDQQGRFLFRGLRPGRYRVRTSGALRSTASTDVVLRPDALAGSARLEVEMGAAVSGTVLDHQARPLGNYPVRVVGFDAGDGLNSLPVGVNVMQRTAEDGHFHLDGLPSGIVYVQATSNRHGYSPAVPVLSRSGSEVGGISLVVADEREELERARAEGAGIGVRLDFTPRGPVIDSLVAGMAAEEAGLRVGDLITHVGERPTRFMSTRECVDRCRGPVGSTVEVTVLRDEETIDVQLVRRTFPPSDR